MPCHHDTCALLSASSEACSLVAEAVEYGSDARTAPVAVRDEARDALEQCIRNSCDAHRWLGWLARELDQRLCLGCKCWVSSDVADESDGLVNGYVCHDCLAAEEDAQVGPELGCGGCEICGRL